MYGDSKRSTTIIYLFFFIILKEHLPTTIILFL